MKIRLNTNVLVPGADAVLVSANEIDLKNGPQVLTLPLNKVYASEARFTVSFEEVKDLPREKEIPTKVKLTLEE